MSNRLDQYGAGFPACRSIMAGWKACLHNRLLRAVLLLAMCSPLPGCVFSNWFNTTFPDGPFKKSVPCVLPPNASKSELITHLNENIAKLNAWRSTDVRIQTRGPGGIPIKLAAVIAVESPRGFRLRARSTLGGDEADFGSNAERFWFWMRRSEPKYVFTARHADLHLVQQRMRIPFQPDWLMEALGVIPLDESQYTLERSGTEAGVAKLVSDRLSPDGKLVRQVVLVDTCHGFIKQHSLHDSAGELIARATLKDHKHDVSTGVTLPRQIDLFWPETKMSLSMHLDGVEINPTGIPEQTWQLPNIRGYPPFDMGPRLRRNQFEGQVRGGYDARADFIYAREPVRESEIVRTVNAEEPPWENESEPPEEPRPARRKLWPNVSPFRRR